METQLQTQSTDKSIQHYTTAITTHVKHLGDYAREHGKTEDRCESSGYEGVSRTHSEINQAGIKIKRDEYQRDGVEDKAHIHWVETNVDDRTLYIFTIDRKIPTGDDSPADKIIPAPFVDTDSSGLVDTFRPTLEVKLWGTGNTIGYLGLDAGLKGMPNLFQIYEGQNMVQSCRVNRPGDLPEDIMNLYANLLHTAYKNLLLNPLQDAKELEKAKEQLSNLEEALTQTQADLADARRPLWKKVLKIK